LTIFTGRGSRRRGSSQDGLVWTGLGWAAEKKCYKLHLVSGHVIADLLRLPWLTADGGPKGQPSGHNNGFCPDATYVCVDQNSNPKHRSHWPDLYVSIRPPPSAPYANWRWQWCVLEFRIVYKFSNKML